MSLCVYVLPCLICTAVHHPLWGLSQVCSVGSMSTPWLWLWRVPGCSESHKAAPWLHISRYTTKGCVFKNYYSYHLWILETLHESSSIKNGFSHVSVCVSVIQKVWSRFWRFNCLLRYSGLLYIHVSPNPTGSILCTSEQWPLLLQMHHTFLKTGHTLWVVSSPLIGHSLF